MTTGLEALERTSHRVNRSGNGSSVGRVPVFRPEVKGSNPFRCPRCKSISSSAPGDVYLQQDKEGSEVTMSESGIKRGGSSVGRAPD